MNTLLIEILLQNEELQVATKQWLKVNFPKITQEFCRRYKTIIILLGKPAAKVALRELMKYHIEKVMTLHSTGLTVTLIADLTQEGLKFIGYEDAGMIIGGAGNVATFAAFGYIGRGPGGLVVGALVGFLVWGAGEIAGSITEHVLS
ncbi:uncharacterized protein [Dysidea avara]|uniref:uncharacterized protein n=1 Tax=Dysidea avara TaxID=196820 RepID=UPI003322AE7F